MTSDQGEAPPLVSVVIPVKNAAPFLREALDSVLAQTWRELEVVLVDDGGDDGSDVIAAEYGAAHVGRVRIVTHEGRANQGIGPSRAFGIREARGDIVAFIDADDVWEPTHVSDYARLLLAHPEADLVCGRVWTWHSWASPRAEDRLSELAFAPGAVVPGPRLLAAVLRNGNLATTPCSLMVRRQPLLGCLESLEKFPGLYEDQVMTSWLQLRTAAVMTGATTAWYRQHTTSFSARGAGRQERVNRARIDYHTWLLGQIAELGNCDPEVVALAERALREAQERAARPQPTGLRRLLRTVLPPGALRGIRALRRALTPMRGPSGGACATQLQRVLFRNGADVRGEVLLLGATTDSLPMEGETAAVLTTLPWPRPAVSGPGHALASLATAAYDCIVVLVDEGGSGNGDLGLRHLRRALRPAGVLLWVAPHGRKTVEQQLQVVFGWDAVIVDRQQEPGPNGRSLVVLRAATPAA